MTDKNINKWVEKLSKENHFLLDKTFKGEENSKENVKVLSENLDIDYLENKLNLVVRLLSENKDANFIKLSLKGIDVVNAGGWIKYKAEEKSNKRTN